MPQATSLPRHPLGVGVVHDMDGGLAFLHQQQQQQQRRLGLISMNQMEPSAQQQQQQLMRHQSADGNVLPDSTTDSGSDHSNEPKDQA